MHCVKSERTIEDSIKKSRFIGIITPCSSEVEIAEKLHTLHQQHPHANHIAFAYSINTPKGTVIRFHDAGEPGGTAGKPILQQLEGKKLMNVLIAVVRYFGGVKLGAGGLTRAYGNTAGKAIDAAEIIEFVEYETVQFKLDYKQMQEFEYHVKKLDGEILDQNFSDFVILTVKLPQKNKSALIRMFG